MSSMERPVSGAPEPDFLRSLVFAFPITSCRHQYLLIVLIKGNIPRKYMEEYKLSLCLPFKLDLDNMLKIIL